MNVTCKNFKLFLETCKLLVVFQNSSSFNFDFFIISIDGLFSIGLVFLHLFARFVAIRVFFEASK